MRITGNLSVKSAYYDRNPLTTIGLFYSATGIAPHIQTTRATYTVPTGRRAIVEMTHVQVYCSAAPAPPLKVIVKLIMSLSGVAFTAGGRMTAIADQFRQSFGGGALVATGETVSITTGDTATGGTNEYDLTVKLTEYDV